MRIIILIALLFSTSCAPVRNIVLPEKKLPLNIAEPAPLDLKEVQFVVITKDNAAKIFENLDKKGVDAVVFALSGADYKALSYNVESIRNYLFLQKQIILLYKNYYEGTNGN